MTEPIARPDTTPPEPSSEARERIEEIARRYTADRQAGLAPDLEALLAANPDVAEDLRRRLALVDALREARRARAGRSPGATPPRDGTPSEDSGLDERHPASVGPYAIRRVLGKGGMGIVYLAEQAEPVRREVALKLVKAGMDTEEVVARFDKERQALALLDHPYVARVYDGGATPDGRPYFAMEYVPGVSIREYCDRNRLPTRDRLRLFTKVCEAVQHAHQKSVIHRDLKPTNIIITDRNGGAVPKVIDFGLAKATNRWGPRDSLVTAVGQLIGTPDYMSPEQADPSGTEVDTRTDVYSLGVVLYELITGVLPYGSPDGRATDLPEIRRRIRDEEPQKPSTRISSLGAEATPLAHNRRTRLETLRRQLRGDLDWIAMKALEKDRTRRYATASELAADIERHLADEPVLAGPPNVGYRLRKLVRRHRAVVVAGALVLVSLIGGLGASTALYLQARAAAAREKEQRERAEREWEKAEAVSGYLEDLIGSVDPMGGGRRDTRVVEILDRAEADLGEQFREQPLVEAHLRRVLGGSYHQLGYPEKAEPILLRSLEIYRREVGGADARTVMAMNDLAEVYHSQGRREEAEGLLQHVVDWGTTHEPCHERCLYVAMGNLADILIHHYELDEAEDLLERARAGLARIQSRGSVEMGNLENLRGHLLQARGESGQAREVIERALLDSTDHLGPDHAMTLTLVTRLAGLMGDIEENQAVLDLLEENIPRLERVLGPEHPKTLFAMNRLGTVHLYGGRLDEARPILESVYETRLRLYGEEHPDTLVSADFLGLWHLKKREYGRAMEILERTLELTRKIHGEEDEGTLIVGVNLGEAYARGGKRKEALGLFEHAWRTFSRIRGEDHPDSLDALGRLVRYMSIWGGQDERAEELQRRRLELTAGKWGPLHDRTLDARAGLTRFLTSRKKLEEAREILVETLEMLERDRPEGREAILKARDDLAHVLDGLGDGERADSLLAEVLAERLETSGIESEDTVAAITCYSNFLASHGRQAEAEKLLVERLDLERKEHGPHHLHVFQATRRLDNLYRLWASNPGAPALRRARLVDGVALGRRCLEPGNPRLLKAIYDLARDLRSPPAGHAEPDPSGAEELLREVVETGLEALSARNRLVRAAWLELGGIQMDQERLDVARDTFLRAHEIFAEAVGENHDDTVDTLNWLGLIQERKGDLVAATETFERCLAAMETPGAKPSWRRGTIVYNVGRLHWLRGLMDEAEPHLVRAYEEHLADPRSAKSRAANYARQLVEFYEAWGKPDEAERYRKLLPEDAAEDPPTPGPP